MRKKKKHIFFLLVAFYLITIADHSEIKKMDFRCQICISQYTLHKAFANLSNHNLFVIFSDERQINLNDFKFSPDSEKIPDNTKGLILFLMRA